MKLSHGIMRLILYAYCVTPYFHIHICRGYIINKTDSADRCEKIAKSLEDSKDFNEYWTVVYNSTNNTLQVKQYFSYDPKASCPRIIYPKKPVVWTMQPKTTLFFRQRGNPVYVHKMRFEVNYGNDVKNARVDDNQLNYLVTIKKDSIDVSSGQIYRIKNTTKRLMRLSWKFANAEKWKGENGADLEDGQEVAINAGLKCITNFKMEELDDSYNIKPGTKKEEVRGFAACTKHHLHLQIDKKKHYDIKSVNVEEYDDYTPSSRPVKTGEAKA